MGISLVMLCCDRCRRLWKELLVMAHRRLRTRELPCLLPLLPIYQLGQSASVHSHADAQIIGPLLQALKSPNITCLGHLEPLRGAMQLDLIALLQEHTVGRPDFQSRLWNCAQAT